ncbi:MAG: HTH domain-containing protein [Lachnospiraceae bacterium]|nr:HTH domain-containing protein [Lachnospiraceae bacterium]
MTTKEKIIEALEAAKGNYISGEELAKICGVSRNAIWKNITELKKKGYIIQSVNNRGYMLEVENDIISKAGILLYLQKDYPNVLNSLSVVMEKNIYVYDEIDSTNMETKRFILTNSAKIEHGTLIVANSQSFGQGHGGTEFVSPKGGIYFSLLLDPSRMNISAKKNTKMISNIVSKVLENTYQVAVNRAKDSSLYVEGEKVCGILTEGISDLETGVYTSYIVGVGIRAEKLKAISEIEIEKNKIIAKIIGTILENVNLE